ncbi:MAG: transglutaminase domain-containing protein [Anaerovoracaceae bacterium]
MDKRVSRSRMSDEEIALAVHDYIAANTMYDRSFSGSHINDLYGALVGHKAVCEGYAQAYQYVMQHYGVHTGIVTSDNACHAWNIVKIRGNWYHVDVTWDDPIKGSSATDEPGAVNHNYFLLSTSTLLKKAAATPAGKTL